ncbi:MAG: glycosyltransferase N-terminal domain-containing protein [Bacteroidales bacterium]|nr:glycosyltransferase N-terminal domain-containing protein [Bacteroidales bacterium]
MILLYNFIIKIYYSLIFISSFFNKKARLWISGRKNWIEILKQKRKFKDNWIWFHCSSLGEYEDCCEIFNKIKNENPQKKTLLTFFSPSGFEVLKRSNNYDLVLYLPLDTPNNSKQFLEILQPQSVFFSRSELWLNYIVEIKKRNIPLFLLSLLLNKKSNFLKWPANLIYKECFAKFDHIYCQNEITKQILENKFKNKNTSVTGNTRFDRAYNETKNFKELKYINDFVQDNFVVVAGSCLPKDEINILKICKKFESNKIKWIIVPHYINERNLNKITNKNQNKIIRYSNILNLNANHSILYVDCVGILKYIYKYCNIAVIGGGFNKCGIHNIIEPSVYGLKTTFGPNHNNFPEAIDLIKIGGAVIHCNSMDLYSIIVNELESKNDFETKNKIISYVQSNVGGSIKIVESIRMKFSKLI